MSIIIKGMEMPKDGVYWCEIGVAGDIATITIHGEDRRAYNLVPVPPHGRLGDLDALYEKFVRLENEAMQALKTTNAGSVNWIKWSAILTERTGYKFDIADAPTIIPAEEGET